MCITIIFLPCILSHFYCLALLSFSLHILSLILAVTFVNLLLEVESTYEVHDYIKSFLGESDAVHSFAKQFLERRQKIRNYTTSTGQVYHCYYYNLLCNNETKIHV